MKKIVIKGAAAGICFAGAFLRPLKLKKKVAIISRQSDMPSMDIRYLEERLKSDGIETVVLCKTLGGMKGAASYGFHMLRQMKALATSRVVVLDSYCIPASLLSKKEGQTILQIWHSLGAIKKFGWASVDNPDGRSLAVAQTMKMHRNYDYILAPSRETGKHFAEGFHASEDQIVLMGLPRIDYIRQEEPEVMAEIRKAYPVTEEKINVLYVPTFRRHAALAIEKLVEGFDFEHMNLIIKKHFLDKGDYTWAEEKSAIVDSRFTSLQWMKYCRKIVTDYSAISIEAAVLEKEIYIYQPDVETYAADNGLNIDMHEEAIAPYVCETEEQLFHVLKEPYDMECTHAFRARFLDICMEDVTGQLCSFIEEKLSDGPEEQA